MQKRIPAFLLAFLPCLLPISGASIQKKQCKSKKTSCANSKHIAYISRFLAHHPRRLYSKCRAKSLLPGIPIAFLIIKHRHNRPINGSPAFISRSHRYIAERRCRLKHAAFIKRLFKRFHGRSSVKSRFVY